MTSSIDLTYDALAQSAIQRWESMQDMNQKKGRRRQLWIALAGAPGSGKSTCAQAVVDRIHQKPITTTSRQPLPSRQHLAIVVPMDGFHFTQLYLEQHDMDLKRRGAPWTFDAESMVRELLQAKSALAESRSSSCTTVALPGYSRDISDPVPDVIEVSSDHDIVIVEGLYVLLGCLEEEAASLLKESCDNANDSVHESVRLLSQAINADDEWTRRSIQDEVARWKPLLDLWDDLWFVAPPLGLQENKRRLVERSLKTWTPEKTRLWSGTVDPCTDLEAVQNRVAYNDFKNAQLVSCCQQHARVHIDSV